MVASREAVVTATFSDNYCAVYRDLFVDVHSFETSKFLHWGMVSEIFRKLLPTIAKVVGLPNDQILHHCLSASPQSVTAVRKRRLELILQRLRGKAITLVINETGDRKKGKTIDYVDRQHIGNLGNIDNEAVSVNTYGFAD